MQLTQTSRNIVIAVIAGFIAVIGLIVALTSVRPEPAVQGSITSTLEKVEDAGLNATALSPSDVYGEQWVAAGIICPGMDDSLVKQQFQVEPQLVGLREGQTVEEHKNMLILRDQQGGAHVEEFSRYDVDLCTAPVQGYFNTQMLMPLIKTEIDNWALALQ